MKVSIIIPAFNEANHILECLASIGDQSYAKIEIIVIDDGSDDSTQEIAKKFTKQVYAQAHLGAGAARNLGAAKASGKILVFVDADMVLSREYVSDLIAPILKGKTKGTFSLKEEVANYQNIWAKSWNHEYVQEISSSRIPSNHASTSVVFRAILKSEFDKSGGYDEVGYGEDWSLSSKLGYLSTATNAIVYHKNPESFSEVFSQASWIATRAYKLGELGRAAALLRASLPVSLIMSMVGIIKYKSLFYQVFKLTYDAGIFFGIIKYWAGGGNGQ